MTHRALVVGVDDYLSQSSLKLQGAVSDAISFAKWLIDSAGGAVTPDKVTLLTSPALTPSPPELAGVDFVAPATAGNIIQQLLDIPNKPADPGDRFYFYFSGHGLTAPNDIAQEAILPADFTFLNTGTAIGVRAIQDWLKTSRFNQHFLFIDACRNAMLARRFSVPTFAIPDPSQLRPQVEQFVYMSTSRGLSAAEAQLVGNTRAGVFTTALVSGLRGAGEAKFYNVSGHTYDVTSNSLVPYLTNAVRKQIAKLTMPNGADPTAFLQTPTLTGERFSDPVICSFDRQAFGKVTLSINFDPSTVHGVSKIVVERDDIEIHVASPVPNIPYQIELPPKEYSVTATAENYKPTPVAFPLKLYDDASLEFKMVSAPADTTAAQAVPSPAPSSTAAAAHASAAAAAGSAAAPQPEPLAAAARPREGSQYPTVDSVVGDQLSTASFAHDGTVTSAQIEVSQDSGPSAAVDSVTETVTSSTQPQPDTGHLIVATADDSSTLEIVRSGNEHLNRERAVVASGQLRLEATLPPDLYAARLWAPNGRNVEKLVRLRAGTTETVWLAPPSLAESDPVLELAKQTGFSAEGGIVTLSESSGLSPLAWVRLSTIISMAAIAQVFPTSLLAATRLRSLGLTTLGALPANTNAAVQIIVGDEMLLNHLKPSDPSTTSTPEHAQIDSIFVTCLPLEAPYIEHQNHLVINPQYDFIGEQSVALEPGAYWLCIRDPASSGTFLPITVSPNRVTTVVFTRNSRGRVSIFMYQPSATAADPQETMRMERRIEMAQRYFMSGQMGDAHLLSPVRDGVNSEQLLKARQYDPIGALLGAYLSLRAFEAQQPSGDGSAVASPQPVPAGSNMEMATTARLVDDVAEHFGLIPDAHVLKAEFQLKSGDRETATASVLRAFDTGLPMFDEGALRLAKLASSLSVEHPRVSLLQKVICRRIPGMLWTVCALDRAPQLQDPLPAPFSWSEPVATQRPAVQNGSTPLRSS